MWREGTETEAHTEKSELSEGGKKEKVVRVPASRPPWRTQSGECGPADEKKRETGGEQKSVCACV